LGGVVVFLTWLYLSAYIVLIGGEMNSELERQQAKAAALPAQAAGTAAVEAESEAAAPPTPGSRRPERVSWPLAALGFLLSRRSPAGR
jgi:membrane protein